MRHMIQSQLVCVALISAGSLALAGQALAEANLGAGEVRAKLVCGACHGSTGNAPVSPEYPKIGGQHADYLLNALMDYKKGARKNPIMAGQVESLSKQDMTDLAAYFASQKSSLTVKY